MKMRMLSWRPRGLPVCAITTCLHVYGLGLAERRFGYFLHDKKRTDYVVSSKVGKLLKASKTYNRDLFPFSPSPNNIVFDYTGPGTRRSIEDSLQRLGIDSLDIAFVHDLSPDNTLLPTPWEDQFKIAMTGSHACAKRESSRAGALA